MSQTTKPDRSKMDFSDIDDLGRATESFMREQRKALGHRGVNISEIIHHCKRSMVFVVLGAVFVTALVCGIRFAYDDSAMRDPQQTQGEEAPVSMPTTDASSTDVTKQEVEGGGTTPTTSSTVQSYVSTTPTTFPEDNEIASTPLLTEDSALQTEASSDTQSTAAGSSTTNATTSQTAVTTTKSTSASTKTTTTVTTTVRTSTTLTTTVSTTKLSTTTTTTTTTAAKTKLEYFNPHVSNVTEKDGVYTQTVNVQILNSGTATCRSLTLRISCPNEGKFVSVKDALYSSKIGYAGNTITVYYSEQIPANSFAQVKLTVQSTHPLTTCSVVQ